MKKLLITGAYGLVGSNLCKILERDYPEIEITKVKHILPYHRDTSEDDVYPTPEPLPEMQDFIIYASGYGQPSMFGKDKLETIKINTTYLTNLFTYLKPEGKFLFVSTAEVYSGAPSPHKETDIGTTTPQHPRACYIEGKRCGEAICGAYREQGYDVKIARLALAYGPGTKKSDTRVINQFIEQALTTGEIKIKDAGEVMRTYCYVDDACEMMLDILFKGTQPVYNVGGKSDIQIRNLASQIADATNSKLSIGKMGLVGAPDHVKLDLSLTLTEFPRTFISLDEGLRRTIEFQKKLYAPI